MAACAASAMAARSLILVALFRYSSSIYLGSKLQTTEARPGRTWLDDLRDEQLHVHGDQPPVLLVNTSGGANASNSSNASNASNGSHGMSIDSLPWDATHYDNGANWPNDDYSDAPCEYPGMANCTNGTNNGTRSASVRSAASGLPALALALMALASQRL
mmetsp:Transcript_25523/g.57981  ORF Transcript_25523/g.57981 Transcript_25523/m.57981 type:complete len:160 (-) Transcript_25523:59-538(-)